MKEYNPDYLQEGLRRIKNLQAMTMDKEIRAKAMEVYSTDPIRWINDWAITFNPRNKNPIPKILPFILFPRQEDFVHFLMSCVDDSECGLIEKSRDIGATWICCAFSVWLWLFVPGAAIGWGSRKEDLVDRRGDPDSIFEKIRMIIGRLPRWMLPVDYNERSHSTSMNIRNPNTGAIIAGESGDQIGRGGRKMIYFKDEAAHYERPELIEAALGDNTDVQIDISSVHGTNNVFYRRRQAGQEWTPDRKIEPGVVRVFIFDWRDHPKKNQAWYDLRKKKAEAEGLMHIFAQEVDRDYSASIEGMIIRPEWVRACLDAHIKLAHLGDWFAGEKMAAQDIADGGADLNAYCSSHGAVIMRLDKWAGEAGDAALTAIPHSIDDEVQELYYDCIGVGAGFKVKINEMKGHPAWPKKLRVMPWDASAFVLNPTDNVIPNDDQSPTNEDTYENLKAQAWFLMRARCWKTYLAITRQAIYPIHEMISFPSDIPYIQQLVMELSQAVKKVSLSSGKTVVDKTPKGSRSPNLADAAVMCKCPTREASSFDSL